jgi:peptidoglycan/LPS O-acetylase OafA/YrhL
VKSERSEVIDLLKAFACVLIVWHHLALYGPMSDVVSAWVPRFIGFLFDHGLLAVQVFLVVAGYLNAKSWIRALVQADFHFFARLLARYQRLVIPLLAALSFTVAITALVRPYFEHPSLSDAPTPLQVVAHMLLLQDVLYLEAFSAGVWYVAIDFQLFAMALMCAAVAHRWQSWTSKGSVIRKALGLWLTLTLGSLFVWNLNPLGEIWGTYFFSAYGLGLCVGCWRRTGLNVQHRILALLITLFGVCAWLYQPRIRLLVAVVIAVLLALYEATDCKPLPWLQAAWVQALSNASYAIFLIHFGVSLLVSAVVFTHWSESVPLNALGMLSSFGLSLLLGRVLHTQVESQPPSWRRFLQWAGTFVATCTAVILLN